LSEPDRTTLLLYYLEGKTTRQAAQQLGQSVGMFIFQLKQARDTLRQRLRNRRLVLTSTELSSLLREERLSATVSAPLIHSTVRAAMLFALGRTSAAATIAERAVAIAQGVS
jgi:hypothetical protein